MSNYKAMWDGLARWQRALLAYTWEFRYVQKNATNADAIDKLVSLGLIQAASFLKDTYHTTERGHKVYALANRDSVPKAFWAGALEETEGEGLNIMSETVTCWMCNGKQAIEVVGLGERYKMCPRCHGVGTITMSQYEPPMSPADALATAQARIAELEAVLQIFDAKYHEAISWPATNIGVDTADLKRAHEALKGSAGNIARRALGEGEGD